MITLLITYLCIGILTIFIIAILSFLEDYEIEDTMSNIKSLWFLIFLWLFIFLKFIIYCVRKELKFRYNRN
jgi:succinate dehydrogenase hydrophobic anchor subunit